MKGGHFCMKLVVEEKIHTSKNKKRRHEGLTCVGEN